MKLRVLIIFLTVFGLDQSVSAAEEAKNEKKVINRKIQKVDFEGDSVDGTARTPDGSYVSHKRSVDFIPLYKVREGFDESIRNSVEYLK